tara:strand:- start:10544 stop:11344 length:801 start_codon:yes stop_codon:yes gene_type:complete
MIKEKLCPVDKFYIWLEEDIERVAAEALLPRKVKRGRKPTKKIYFDYRNEAAIVAFNKETIQSKRDKIYREHINAAFNKLVENIIHTFKFYYFDVPYVDVKAEVVAFLNEKIHKFTEGKGKAFSYFSIIAKNYLIIANNANYAKMKQKAEVSAIDDMRDLNGEQQYTDYQETLRDFTDQFVIYYDDNLSTLFTNKRDIIVADSLLELFRIRENIENFNKKSIYILIRERTGLKTQNITKVVNRLKKDFALMFKEYQRTGHFLVPKS